MLEEKMTVGAVRTTFMYLSMKAKVTIILTLNLLNNNFQVTDHLPMHTCTSKT